MPGLFSPAPHVGPFADRLLARTCRVSPPTAAAPGRRLRARRMDGLPADAARRARSSPLAARVLLSVPGGTSSWASSPARPLPLARRVRATRPLARLRLHLGDVARHRARRRRSHERDRSRRPTVARRHASTTPTYSIVGSGAGGATTAALLAEAGVDVLVVEEGPWVEQGVGRARSRSSRWTASTAPAASPSRSGCPSIAYTEGRCAGGGTEINSGLYRRPPRRHARALAARLRDRRLRPGRARTPSRDEIEQRARACSTVPGAHDRRPATMLRRGADALGWRHSEIPRWMTYPPSRRRRSTGQRQSMTAHLPAAGDSRPAPGCSSSAASTDS